MTRQLLLCALAATLLVTASCLKSKERNVIVEDAAPKYDHDYEPVRRAIWDIAGDKTTSYGPILVRLAWHSSGSYSKYTRTGGSDGARMRFSPEKDYGGNKGLDIARDALEPIKQKFSWISYADLYTLAGAVAVESMGGPFVPWRHGRKDADDGAESPPDGRLPDASQGPIHVRDVFKRLGFSARDTVALIGAHSVGSCHSDRSGYQGPWTTSPTTFSNDYYKNLLHKKWVPRQWDGPLQYQDEETGKLMMLPADMALLEDREYKRVVEKYAEDEYVFFRDFANAFGKMLELGVKRGCPFHVAKADAEAADAEVDA